MFDKLKTDVRNGLDSVIEHITHVTENEFKQTRAYLETELAGARREIDTLKESVAEIRQAIATRNSGIAD